MAFPVIGGTQVSGYNIDNSLRFNDDDTAYLSRTRSSQSNTTGTFSVWTKMGNPGADNVLFGGATDVNNRSYIYFSDPDGFVGIFSRTSGSADIAYNSNGRFRDPSAWYHVVVAIDTTQGTAGNRFKMYINGTQYTDWGTATAPSQNASLPILNQSAQTVGGGFGASAISAMAEGYMANAYYIDGQQLDASNFGETNDNGVWIPKNYTGSYGTNGFKLEFKQLGTAADATSIGADTSGNDNHFSQTNVTPAVDRTTDTPTNNFCTFNPLKERPGEGYATFSEGNCKATGTSLFAYSSFVLPSSGKWYAEFKATAGSSTAYVALLDVDDYTTDGNTNRLFYRNDGQKDTGSGASSYGNSWTTGDILSIAASVDDSEVTFYKNGVAQDSGTAISQTCANQYIIVATAGGWTFEANFGNPPFTISSGNSDANGYGNFEYAPPANYYSLCSKNLAEYG
jgi:hypothetical protein